MALANSVSLVVEIDMMENIGCSAKYSVISASIHAGAPRRCAKTQA